MIDQINSRIPYRRLPPNLKVVLVEVSLSEEEEEEKERDPDDHGKRM